MKYDSEFSHKYAANLKSIIEQAARLFSSAFGIDDLEIAEQFAAIFMATLDGFAIQQILHTIPEDDTSYADTMLDFFKTCVPAYIENLRQKKVVKNTFLFFTLSFVVNDAFILHNQYAMMSLRFFVDSTVYLILSVCIDPLLTYTLCTKSSFLYSAKK